MDGWLPVLVALSVGVTLGLLATRLGWFRTNKFAGLDKTDGKPSDNLDNHYFRGINYLLNEQPDKALEVFLQLAEVTPETVETHLSLGSLFRRRGEMDNAIRCHQNIINQTGLSAKERDHALLELGEDYLRAGLLDRAEELFYSLAEQEISTQTALQRLLNIFQQEHEWQSAIHVAQQLQRISDEPHQTEIAHFYCELAMEQCHSQQQEEALRLLEKAEQSDPQCARLWIQRAQLATQNKQSASAIQYYEKACEIDPNCLPLVLHELIQAFREAGRLAEASVFLNQWLIDNTDTSAVIAAVDLIHEQKTVSAASTFLLQQLKRLPTVGKMRALLQLSDDGNSNDFSLLDVFGQLSDSLREHENGYQCRVCGLRGQTHHWHCPSCRSWNTTLPVRGILGE